MKWFHFLDYFSGGELKTECKDIFIQAKTEGKAISKFISVFGIDPENMSCECCGSDYCIEEFDEYSAYKEEFEESKEISIGVRGRKI